MEEGKYKARDFIPHSACGLIRCESFSLGMCHLPFSSHKITNNMHPDINLSDGAGPVMCESESGFGFESGFRAFWAGFGFGFRAKK